MWDQTPVPPPEPFALPAIDWESAGKSAAIVLGLCYVVGILTVNTYLYRIGVAEFSLLQAQYVYTGALTLAPVITCSLAPLYAYYMLKDPLPDAAAMKVHRIFQSYFFRFITVGRWMNVIFSLLLPLVIFVLLDSSNGIKQSLMAGLKFYLVSAFTGVIAFGLFLFVSKKGVERPRSPRLVVAFGVLVFFVSYTGWYLSLFTSHIYVNIPGQFGGGMPTLNRFVFFPDKAAVAGALAIPVDKTTLSPPIKLLVETDKSYVIETEGGSVVRLSKELIAAVQVVK